MIGLSILCSALAFALAAPGDGEQRVVVAPLAVDGDVRPVAEQRIREAFLDGLTREGLPAEEATGGAAAACTDAKCLATLASEAGTTHAVRLSVSAAGRDYTLQVQLVSTDGTISEASADCPICGFDEVAEVASQEAGKLARKLLKQGEPAVLSVTTDPPGALVTVDGEPFGTTPVREQLPEGTHVVQVEREGYVVRTREVVSTGGVVESLDLELQLLPKKGNTTLLYGVGGALAAVGLAGVAGGATMLAFHHKPANGRCDKPENIDANGLCRWRYNTLGAGIGIMAGGLAAAVVGTTLVVVASKRSRGTDRRRARIEPRLGGVAVVF